MSQPDTLVSRYYLLTLALPSVLVLWTIAEGELSGIPDTYAHTMLGVFFADFLREKVFLKSFTEIFNYIWNYYAHYNNISLLHWPHFYHLVEGIFFLIFGVNVVVARLVTYLFFVVGLTYYFRLLRAMYDEGTAFLASLLFCTSPLVLFLARSVTLEIPSLTLSLIATYYFYLFTREPRSRHLFLTAVFTALALLTKQTAIYLLGFFIFFSFYKYYRDKKWFFTGRQFLLFLAVVVILTAPYYIVSFVHHGEVHSKDSFKGLTQFLSLYNYVYYFVKLPKQLTWTTIVLLGLFLVSLGTGLSRPLREQEIFLLLWALSCYLLFTLLASKEPRYIIYWVPALCGLAAPPVLRGAARLASSTAGSRLPVMVLMAVVSLATLTEAWLTPRARVAGFEEVSRFLLSQVPPEQKAIVFFEGDFPGYGALVFATRKADPERRLYLFRASKFLYAVASFPQYGLWEIRTREEEIKEFFRKYGIRYLFVHFIPMQDWEKVPVIATLRRLVSEDPDFVLAKKFPITFHMHIEGELSEQQGDLLLYEFRQATQVPLGQELDIPMPSIGRTITIRLK